MQTGKALRKKMTTSEMLSLVNPTKNLPKCWVWFLGVSLLQVSLDNLGLLMIVRFHLDLGQNMNINNSLSI